MLLDNVRHKISLAEIALAKVEEDIALASRVGAHLESDTMRDNYAQAVRQLDATRANIEDELQALRKVAAKEEASSGAASTAKPARKKQAK